MLSSKIILRGIHTSLLIHARPRWINRDPGIKKRLTILDADDPYKREIEEDEDIDSLESDLQNVDLTYPDHKRELFKKRQFIGKKITERKFFSGPKPPNMLTWAERLQIKHLHESDPDEWTLDVLAESFPATRETISKILSKQWKPKNVESMKRKDEIVHENWKRLAKNKLDAEPELLQHLQKFLPRREEFLSALQNNGDITQLLEKPKPKKVWNNGQMSKILESYDNSLKLMEEKQKIKQHLLESREVVEERIQLEVSHLGGVESFKLNNEDRPSIPTTLPQLKRTLISKEKIDMFEEVIIAKEKSVKGSGVKINSRLAMLAGYKLESGENGLTANEPLKKQDDEEIYVQHKNQMGNLKSQELEVNMESEIRYETKNVGTSIMESDKSSMIDQSNLSSLELGAARIESKENISPSVRYNKTEKESKENLFISSESSPSLEIENATDVENLNNAQTIEPTIDGKVTQKKLTKNEKSDLSQSDFSKKTENSKLLEESTEVTTGAEVKIDEELTKTYEFPSERDREDFEKEESSITQTFFWHDKSEAAQTEVVNVDLDVKKYKVASVKAEPEYAERIKVPKDKRGSGLTFRVKDCFYDDDGQFLYRVPGMTKAVVEEK